MTEQDESEPEIYIGDKDLGNYVKALKHRLAEIEETVAVARGNFIRKAVDAAEIVKREEDDVEVVKVNIDTDEGENDDGETFRVSKIDIRLEGTIEETEDEE